MNLNCTQQNELSIHQNLANSESTDTETLTLASLPTKQLGGVQTAPTKAHTAPREPIVRVVVRSDIPLGAQMAQSQHASMKLTALYPEAADAPIAVLSISGEEALLQIEERLLSLGIAVVSFFEPDWPRGYSALAYYLPVRTHKASRITANLPLWNPNPQHEPLWQTHPTDEANTPRLSLTPVGEDLLRARVAVQLLTERLLGAVEHLEKSGAPLSPELLDWHKALHPVKHAPTTQKIDTLLDMHPDLLGTLLLAHTEFCGKGKSAHSAACARCNTERTLGITP